MSQSPATLADLRRRLDSIDERLLDLLMERARAMEDVRAAKNAAEGPNAKLGRPGRELAILRRLVARIQGPLPPGLVVRIWRDIMTSFTRLQGTFSIAVWDSNANANASSAGGSLMGLARRHYGQATPLLPASSPAQAIARLDDARAQLALLPVPEDAPELNWWRNLSPTGLQVLARLPVDGQETQPGAFVVGRQPFEESGADRGLLIVAAEIQASRAKLIQLLVNAGFAPIGIIAEMAVAGHPLFLVVNETYVGSADARMAALAANGLRAVVAGGYGVPLGLASEPSSKGVRE
jgi:chorismate mutase/prephenate dehydratase